MSKFVVRLWTREEDQFLADNYPVRGAVYCAVHLGRSGTSVRSRARYIGIYQRKNPVPFSEYEDEYLREYFGKRRADDIAEVLGRKEASIINRARTLGLVSKRL